jgi:hypothetical protein
MLEAIFNVVLPLLLQNEAVAAGWVLMTGAPNVISTLPLRALLA